MDFQSEKSFGKLRLRAFQPYHQILCMSKHVKDVEDRSNTPKGCNAIYVEDVEDGKRTYTHILAHNFLNTFFRIENPLSIKEVMSQNVCVCSFPIFDVSNIHSITALRCIWCIFDIFDIFDIHSITALRCIWSIFDIFDMSHTLYSVRITM